MDKSAADTVAEELTALADAALLTTASMLPSDAVAATVLFVEATRVLDVMVVLSDEQRASAGITRPDYDLMDWGWNLAANLLFKEVPHDGAFPLQSSTAASRQSAMRLLRQLGSCSLVKRAADMVRAGVLEGSNEGAVIILRGGQQRVEAQFVDQLETRRLELLEQKLLPTSTQECDWLLSADHVDALMRPLIRPWNTSRGVMMAYDADAAVDRHFFEIAARFMNKCIREVGLHPDISCNGVPLSRLYDVAAVIISLHFKHEHFAWLASQQFPDISIPQSLTIWGPRIELENSIADLMDLDPQLIREAVDLLTLKPNDAPLLRGHTSRFRPLLVDFGNGVVLRPLSSTQRNPLLTVRTINEWRDASVTQRAMEPREEWLRQDIYALFQGNRYRCVDGSVLVRHGGRILTDIDAAIFDGETGELALIQIKWQDFFTNDVRSLVSKAANFTKAMIKWAQTIEQWLDGLDPVELQQALRLKVERSEAIENVYLFGVSRTAARFTGYGIDATHPEVALSTWSQFTRVRLQIGSASEVIGQLHQRLRDEEHGSVLETMPIPTSVTLHGKEIQFADLWHGIEDP